MRVVEISNKKHQHELEKELGKGEASALALASEMENVLLLLDDLKARKAAKKLGIKFTGTLGIIHKAKELHIIEKVKPLVKDLLATNFRIAPNIISEFLRLNDEN